MGEFTKYAHGTPCWIDLGVPDIDAAAEFYGRLFGWNVADLGPEAGSYRMCELRGLPVAGIGPLTEEAAEQGVPPSWTTYFAADSVDDVAERVSIAGGTVLMPAMDVMSAGRMLIAQDPTGGVFGVWQAGDHTGARLANEPGTFGWNELMTRDPATAGEFYSAVFGHELAPMDQADPQAYTVLNVGGRAVGGMAQMPETMPATMPPYWSTCFVVEDTDATMATSREAGGSVLREAQDSDQGRYAVLRDQQGASFAVIQLPESA